MKKYFVVSLIALLFLVGCSQPSPQTLTQVYGTPVRIDYTSYHSAKVYFDSGEPLRLITEEPIVWEDLLYTPHKFSIAAQFGTSWQKLYTVELDNEQ